jgi:hypothetical protein
MGRFMEFGEIVQVCGHTSTSISLSEPQIIHCLLISGTAIEISDGVVQLNSWVTLDTTGDGAAEHRIVSRIAMSDAMARRLFLALQKGLARGGH